MCGICGKFSPEGVTAVEVLQMMESISHRGPDGEGLYIDGCIGLGSRRLSIIDLAGGKQPIGSEDETLWIVANCEIYNYMELRQKLEQSGHIFRTRSDTEVILHLYEDFGDQCVAYLRGMYAFAIWDARQQKLFLTRDRLGQKPLYYASDYGAFWFASEPKAILAANHQAAEMDLTSLHDYLSLRFIPAPRTMFRNIKKLPPAHTLTWQDGTITLRRYWELSFQNKLTLSEAEILEGLQEQLIDSVNTHLVSDVEVGAFLSGGLDSSMVVAILSRDLGQKPRTFAVGVDEVDFDELPYARLVAEQYATQHTEQRVAANLIHSLPEMIWHMDEPSDPIAACMYQAARLAADNVKVVLGGDGGDELFAGFDRYLGQRYIDIYNLIPYPIRKFIVSPVLNQFNDNFSYKNTLQKLRWLQQVGEQRGSDKQYAEATFFFRFNEQEKQNLYGSDVWKQVSQIDSAQVITAPFSAHEAGNALDRMLYTDYLTRLPEHSLMLTDRMSMAHGLEARSPLLDHKLVEYLAKVPWKFKIKGGQTKYLLRKIASDYLPRQIVQRQKQGFMFPIAYWFRNELYSMLKTTLTQSYFVREGLFARKAVEKLLEEHRSQNIDHHVRLWMLLNLDIWHQIFIEGASRESITDKLQSAR